MGARFRLQLASGDFTEFRQFLDDSKQRKEWDDRALMLTLVAPSVLQSALDILFQNEGMAADLVLIRGACLADAVRQARGSDTADATSREQFAAAARFMEMAIAALQQAAELDPADPTPHYLAMDPFIIFSMENELRVAYSEAKHRAPSFVLPQRRMVNARSQKWGGSHDEALEIARTALSTCAPGSDMGGCIFFAHFLVWQYEAVFKNRGGRAAAYLCNKSVNEELGQALDKWILPTYTPKLSSIPHLHEAAIWYYLSKDTVQLKRLLDQTYGVYDDVWQVLGNGVRRYQDACAIALAGPVPKKSFILRLIGM